jgi:hypothetical protein
MKQQRMRFFLSLLLLALILPVAAPFAQKTPDNLEPLPEAPPSPGAVPFDDPSLEPEVTIRERGGEKIEEYRIAGRLYAIKITPKHGVPYFLVDIKGDGNFSRYDGPGENLSVPLWVIHEF